MSAPLMISVAGVRGIVGQSLTPLVVSRFAAAFAHVLPPGPVVVGRDARTSGPMVYRALSAGLMAAGRDVVDLGLATTPTTQIAVERLRAAGGVILTASHNPAPWNALKFLSARGEFLDAQAGRQVREGFEELQATSRSHRFERAVILEILTNSAYRERALRDIAPERFLISRYRTLFGTLQQLAARGRDVNFLTLLEALRESSELGRLGGPETLGAMFGGPSSSAVELESALEDMMKPEDEPNAVWVPFDRLGSERAEPGALDWHLETVLGLDVIDVPAIRARKLRVAVDGCASVGGIAVPRLLERLGAECVELDCVPNGEFTRELEPLTEHLGELGRRVVESGADFGVALDPDADRAAFVDAGGAPLGEEYTVVLGCDVVLAKRRGPVVTNLSTSRMLDAVCARHNVPLTRSPVGEAHVVQMMRAVEAVAGGEGNGGMILPAAHYGRDGLVAVALVAQAMAASGESLRALAARLPSYRMIKAKVERGESSWAQVEQRLRARFADWESDTADGLRLSRGEEWLHVRASGTEPVVRFIAETLDAERTRNLIEEARAALAPARAGSV